MLASWCYTASNELSSDSIAFKAGAEYPLGTKQAASAQKIIPSGTSDILVVQGVNIPAGATFYVNLQGIRQTPTTGSMPFSFVTASPSKLAYQGTDTGDYTIPGSPQQPTIASLQRGMIALTVMSNETTAPTDCIALFGDSIQRGVVGIPWSAPGCIAAGFVPTNWAVSGARLDQNVSVLAKRVAAAKLAQTTIAFTNYGINDTTNGRTPAQLQANWITHWTNLNAQGFRVYQFTITPRSDQIVVGSDWSAANQTPNAATTNINTNNDWLRDGAPISGGVAVPVGTVGALRMGDVGHPLKGIYDYGLFMSTSLNSGIFKDNYTLDGLHPSSTGAAAVQPDFAAWVSTVAQL
jgi:lysophospholipase L1-like esterase